MITNNQKTSLLVPFQIPDYLRDDASYENFILFVQAYYEWMEQNNNVIDRTKNLVNYDDIDRTTDEFLDYYTNTFLPYFPKDALVDKKLAVKFAREMYQTKGTPASYKFLFRVLYNSDFDLFYTKDAVLRASDGLWYVPRSLKLASDDVNFLKVKNYRLIGESSKSLAKIENAVIAGNKIEIFISDIERLFQSGEFIRVVDSNNQDILFDGQPLRAKIVGQVSKITIDSSHRGLLYNPGDPVIVYGGLNESITNPVEAIAVVGKTTTGSIQRINVVNGGYGYNLSPNTVIDFVGLNEGPGVKPPIAVVSTINPDVNRTANVAFIPTDMLGLAGSSVGVKLGNTTNTTAYTFFAAFPTANINSKLSDVLSFTSFSTYPISSIQVVNSGGGISNAPTAIADAQYPTSNIGVPGHLKTLGILAPIQILNGGNGYQVDDVIVFSGGSGYGAYANVTNVSTGGVITKISYVLGENLYPPGGMGYTSTGLPTVTVQSANTQASNASIYVPGILGDGATFSVISDTRVGSIETIVMTNNGEDYVASPNVSLKVQDIVVSNVNISTIPKKNDIIYQGTSLNVATYKATVNSISLLTIDNDPALSTYQLRVFNYSSQPDVTKPLYVNGSTLNISSPVIKNYGDGSAKATASFLNGLVIGQGQYIDTRGQPSSFNVLQDENYNNFTYEITVQKEIAKYRELLLNLLHPTGTKVIGRYAIKSNTSLNYNSQESLSQGFPLAHLVGFTGVDAILTSDFTNKSNNIVQFTGLGDVDISTLIDLTEPYGQNTIIEITPTNGTYIKCEIVGATANTLTLRDNVWLTFANVASVTGNTGESTINITSLTGSYDIINNGIYSDPNYPLKDIIYIGDTVRYANSNGYFTVSTVDDIDYIQGIVTLNSSLTENIDSLLSVNRTFVTPNINLFNSTGIHYIPQLATEDGNIITTENDLIILLG